MSQITAAALNSIALHMKLFFVMHVSSSNGHLTNRTPNMTEPHNGFIIQHTVSTKTSLATQEVQDKRN